MIGRRVFVAVPLPEPAFRAVAGLVEGVRAAADPAVRDVRWVRLDGLHLTLRFIGLSDEDEIAAIVEAMKQAAARSPRSTSRSRAPGRFRRSAGRGRSGWTSRMAATSSPPPPPASTTSSRQSASSAATRPYRAHLTVARSDGVRSGADVARRLVDAARATDDVPATEVVLCESVSGGGPARYEPLRRAKLARPTPTATRRPRRGPVIPSEPSVESRGTRGDSSEGARSGT